MVNFHGSCLVKLNRIVYQDTKVTNKKGFLTILISGRMDHFSGIVHFREGSYEIYLAFFDKNKVFSSVIQIVTIVSLLSLLLAFLY